MGSPFVDLLSTPAVQAARALAYGAAAKSANTRPSDTPTPLGDDEITFIAARDHFYMATISENGWPYVQHRGGTPGFLHVAGPLRLAFADYRGNRQLLSAGNVNAGHRVALMLLDQAAQARLKIIGTAQVMTVDAARALAPNLPVPVKRPVVERAFVIDVVAWDWNCQQHITPRFTAAEIEAALAPLHAEIARLKARVAELEAPPQP